MFSDMWPQQHQGILLHGNSQLTLQAYLDPDWGACLDSRIFISGYILLPYQLKIKETKYSIQELF